MSLLFGSLTQNFVKFGNALNNLDASNPSSLADLESAKSAFTQSAASNAAKLCYLGVGMFAATYICEPCVLLWVCRRD